MRATAPPMEWPMTTRSCRSWRRMKSATISAWSLTAYLPSVGLSDSPMALEFQGDDPVLLRQRRNEEPPGIGAGREAVQQEDGRPLARRRNN